MDDIAAASLGEVRPRCRCAGFRRSRATGPRSEYPDALVFLGAWLADPLRVAAVAPSGRALAELITSEISAATGPVLELGPGTGSFTRALIARGVAERDLTLVELGTDFAQLLQRRYPASHVLSTDAGRLKQVGLSLESMGAVVSGLPILSMTPKKTIAILRGAFACLKPGGAFYQFTYGPMCPVPRPILARLELGATRIGTAMKNVPPAAVYRIARRS
jgi:phosphatidylethanolamine/phosphatidyl-N-methylethanolamine N-methyltransferase